MKKNVIVATGVNPEIWADFVEPIANGTFIGYAVTLEQMQAGEKKPSFCSLPVDESTRIASFDNGNVICDAENVDTVYNNLVSYTEAIKVYDAKELPMWVIAEKATA